MANEPGGESHDVTELGEAERAVGQCLQDQLAVARGEGDEASPGLVRVLECRRGGVVTLRAEDPGEVEREPVGYRESCQKHWLTIIFDSDRVREARGRQARSASDIGAKCRYRSCDSNTRGGIEVGRSYLG